ncbi:hypothetical protein NQ318_011945 [Aromia moschata]|uniref:Uncharacterized protein n=1 Tax=Aromia moschata TaxID=1265417 RepID=A0AAV8XNB6_9CUCU|nr:hypothetical protein NQ318_011945 [Aromia moschata]
MRVCFGTLCFSSRLNAADEEAPQVLGIARPSDTAHRQNHVSSKMASIEELQVGIGCNLRSKRRKSRNCPEEWRRSIGRYTARSASRNFRGLQLRDREILNLRSQLDKFQSVLVVCNPASPKGLTNTVGAEAQEAAGRHLGRAPERGLDLGAEQADIPTIYKDERVSR